jgi:hypothetical protein
VENEMETLRRALAVAKVEISSLRIRLKNAELMYQFAVAELEAAKKPVPAEDELPQTSA